MNHGQPAKLLATAGHAFASAALLMMLGSIAASPSLHAEASVTAKGHATQLEARDASISDVLTALGSTYQICSGCTADLSKTVTGTYTGSVVEIVAHVLSEYDYVLKSAPGKLSITIYGLSKNMPNASTAVAERHNRQPAGQQDPIGTQPLRATHDPAPAAAVSGNDAYPSITIAPSPDINRAPTAAVVAVGSLLETAARSQIAGATAASGADDMQALTQAATTSLQSLASALNKVPHL